jgi:hypothetical protein
MPKVDTPKVGGSSSGSYDGMSFSAAFRQAMKDKGRGGTFTWKGKSYKLETAGDKKAPTPVRPAQSAGRSTTSRSNTPAATQYRANFGAPKLKETPKPVETKSESRKLPPGYKEIPPEGRLAGMGLKTPKYREDKAKGGKVKSYAKGGKIDGIAVRGKTKLKRKK